MMSEAEAEGWRARAEAAEQTVAVLKRRVADLQDGAQTALQHTLARAQQRQAEVRRRQELLAVRNAELQRHSERLASEVAARTHDLNVVHDNVVAGFLAIGADLRVRPGYTRSCRELIQGTIAEGVALGDLFALTGRARLGLEAAVIQVFEDVLPDEVAVEVVARRLPGRDARQLHLDARTVREDGRIVAVLLTITDVSALVAAENENQHYRVLISVLRQRDAFCTFLQDVAVQLAEARAALPGEVAAVRRVVHTIKGNAACFGLQAVVDCAHRIGERSTIVPRDLAELQATVDAFLDQNADVLAGVAADATDSALVSRSALEGLRALAAGGPLEPAIDAWVAARSMRPAAAMLAALPELAERLAERLGKQVHFTIEGGERLVDPVRLGPIVRELGHLVRNAIDHGIEAPEGRGTKPAAGEVAVIVEEAGDDYRFVVRDDGRGIDEDALAATAVACGYRVDDDVRRVDLAFLDGVSTAREVTDISGRGVGMSAVQAAVRRLGGQLAVTSARGRGTAISVSIPKSPARAARATAAPAR